MKSIVALKKELIEEIFLLIVFGTLLWLGIANLYDYRILHSSPWGYFASDSVHNLYLNENLYEQGNWRYSPWYINAGYNNTVNFVLPLFAHLNVNLAYASGLNIYDSLILLTVFFACIGALLMFVLIRSYNKYVAYLSTPLFAFLFFKNFYIAVTWGQLHLIAGSFFLIATVFVLTNLKLDYMPVVLGIFMSALFLTHASEFFFFIGFVLLYIVVDWFSTRKLGLTTIKKLVYSSLVFLVISFYYIVIFKNTYFANYGPSSYKLFTIVKSAGFRVAEFADFGTIIVVALLIGVVFSLYFLIVKKSNKAALIFGLYMLAVGFLNYVGIGNRAFQARFFWPVYLSVFLGTTVYQLMRLFVKELKSIFFLIITIVLFLAVAKAYYYPIDSQGILNQYHWDSFQWLKYNAEKNARIYFFYGDSYDQNAQLLLPAKLVTYATTDKLIENLKKATIPRIFYSRSLVIADSNLAYRKSFLQFGYYSRERNITTFHDADVCNFDYYVFDKSSSYAPPLAQYNMAVRKIMLDSGYFEEVYKNDLVSILRNNNPGADCIPKQGVAIK